MGTYAITGAATGIGAAIKEQLQEQGHFVIVIDIKDADIVADLSSAEGRKAAVSAVINAAPDGLDGFIPCAGLGATFKPVSKILEVNYWGALELIEGLRESLAKKQGSIVLISSNSSVMPGSNADLVELLLSHRHEEANALAEQLEGQHAYASSKLAITRWLRRQTAEYARAGIRMNAVAPGATLTPMVEQVLKDPVNGDKLRQYAASVPVGRMASPEDIANAVSFLLSEASSFICGAVLFADGGHDAMLRADSY